MKNVQSYSDIITNSSSEVFLRITGPELDKAIEKLVEVFGGTGVPVYDPSELDEDKRWYGDEKCIMMERDQSHYDEHDPAEYLIMALEYILKDVNVQIDSE